MTLPQERIYTTDDIYNLPDGERAELIDGQIYYMAPPTRRHQLIAGNLFTIINTYIKSRGVRVSHISLHLPFSKCR